MPCAPRGFFVFRKEGAMPATPILTPRPGLRELAEGCLRRNPYLALRNVSCDCRGGVVVLRGRLPTYYLKQVAQEAVAHLEGVQGVENQIEVVPRTNLSRRGGGRTGTGSALTMGKRQPQVGMPAVSRQEGPAGGRFWPAVLRREGCFSPADRPDS